MAGNSFADALVKAVSKLAPKQYKTESGAIDTGRIVRDNTMSIRPATQSIETPVLNSVTGNTTQTGSRPASSSNRGSSVPASATSGPARVTDGPAMVSTPELDSAVGKPTEQKSVSELLYSPFLSGLFGSSAMPEGLSERDQKAFQRGANAQDVFYNWPAIVSNFLTPGAASPTDTGLAGKATRAGELTQLAAAGGITRGSAGIAKAIQMGEDLLTKDNRHDAFTEEILRERNEAQKKIDEETKNWTPKQKEYYGYAQEIFRMAPTMLMGWAGALGAAGTAAAEGATLAQSSGALSTASRFISGLLTNPTFHHTALEVTGSSYEDAIEKGADEKTAALYATLNGVLNAALEVGGAQELPKEIVGSPFKNALLEYLKSIPEEGMEEVNQGVVERALQALMLDKNNEVQGIQNLQAIFDLATAVNEFKGGAAVSGLVGGGNLVLNGAMGGYRQSPAEQQQQNAQPTTPLAQTILANDQQQANGTQLNAPQAAQEAVSTSGQAETRTAPQNAQSGAQSALGALLSGTVSNSVAERILADPELRAAFEQESGITLTGTKSEQRAAIKGYAAQQAELAEQTQTAQEQTQEATQPTAEMQPQPASPTQTAPANNQGTVSETGQYVQDIMAYNRKAQMLAEEGGEAYFGVYGIPFSIAKSGDQYSVFITDPITDRALDHGKGFATVEDALAYAHDKCKEFSEGYKSGNTAPATPQAPTQTAQTTPTTPAPATNPAGSPTAVPTAPDGSDGTRLSAAVETLQNSPVTNDEMNALIGKTVSEGGYRYMPITNNATVQKATARIQRDGWTKARADWTADVRSGKTSAEMMAVGALLYNNAVNSGDMKAAAEIMADYIAAGTNVAQALQARQIIQSMQPEVRLYMIEKATRDAAEAYGDKLPNGITISEELKEEYRKATTEEERDAIIGRMQEEVAKQLPTTLKEKWTALRYLNMLGNFKTQGRNILGNTSMSLLTSTKDVVRNIVELVANKLSGGKVERTTMLGPVDADLVQAARDFYNKNADEISGDGKYSEGQSGDSFMRGAEDKKRIFRSKILEGMRALTRKAMEKGDTMFIRGRFSRDLAKYLQVNGMDAATFTGIMDGSIEATEAQQALIERAVNNATKEAQEATFHDNNAFSSFATSFLRGDKTPAWAKVIAEGIMPFRKTPANVLVRAEEYSPLGFANAVYTALQAKKGADGVTTNDVINQAAKTLTGSGLLFLGMALRHGKWLTGDEDDEKQTDFDKLRGGQQYALTFPDGRSYTMDWLAPAAVPVFLGAQLWDAIQGDGLTGEDALEIATHITNPLIQMSMLQGVNDALDNLGNSDESNLVRFALNSAMSYFTAGLGNTLLGQAEKTFSGDRRTETFVDANTPIGRWWQRQRGKLGEKVPFTDYNQVEYLDAWGRPQMNTENVFGRALENFASPGYVGQNRSTEVDDELQRLYDAGAGNVFPQRISMTNKINVYDEHGQVTEQRQMTADEYVQVQRQAGQTKLQMVKDLMASPVYDAMSDDARADAIKAIYDYANYQAKRNVEQTMPDNYSDVAALSNPAAYLATSAAWNDAAGNRWNRNYDELDDMMESYQTLAPDVRAMLEAKDSQIRKVNEAYQAGISSQSYFAITDATKDITPPEGHEKPLLYQQVSLIGSSDLSNAEKDVIMGQYLNHGEDGKMSTYEAYKACRDMGFQPQHLAAFYEIFSTTTKTASATKKANIIARAMEYGFTRENAIGLYGMFSNSHKWATR